jgi:hypothetical protein
MITALLLLVVALSSARGSAQRDETRLASAVLLEARVALETPRGVSPMDGVWRLDRARDVGSLVNLLALAGVDSLRRNVMAALDVEDRLTLTQTQFRVQRHTARSDTDQRYRLDVTESVQDTVLGGVRSLVRRSDDGTRVHTTMTRPYDQAVFISQRRIAMHDDPGLMIQTLNFTLPTGQKASCVRYFVRQH